MEAPIRDAQEHIQPSARDHLTFTCPGTKWLEQPFVILLKRVPGLGMSVSPGQQTTARLTGLPALPPRGTHLYFFPVCFSLHCFHRAQYMNHQICLVPLSWLKCLRHLRLYCHGVFITTLPQGSFHDLKLNSMHTNASSSSLPLPYHSTVCPCDYVALNNIYDHIFLDFWRVTHCL